MYEDSKRRVFSTNQVNLVNQIGKINTIDGLYKPNNKSYLKVQKVSILNCQSF